MGPRSLVFGVAVLVLFCSCALAEVPLLERTITLTLNQERLDIALEKISQQGDFTFSYNPSVVDVSRLVTYNFAGNTVREVLDQIFQGGLQYKARGNYIILNKVSVSTSTETTYSGYVVDETTGKRLKNVSVYDPISLSSAVTDDYGYFQIKIEKPSADDVRLAVNRLDYNDTTISVSSSKNSLLRIPMNISHERVQTLADSVSEKLRRFWRTKIMAPQSINIRNIRDTLHRNTQVSVLPFIGTNHKLSGNVINDYSFNVFGGYALGVERLEIGGLFNIDRGDVKGVQFAGVFNAVGGRTNGSQFAGLANLNLDSVKGVQFAGLMNLNWNSTTNFSGAGLLNLTHRNSHGVHLASLGNVTVGDQQGAHLAGLFNFATGESNAQVSGLLNFAIAGIEGVQVGSLINYGGRGVRGAQVSGLINLSPGNITGAQVSGLLNFGKNVRGVQVGAINISDTIRGVPIGLLSFVTRGYHQLEISADEIYYANFAFRTGVPQFYNIFTAGVKPETIESEQTYWTFGYGLGTAPKLTRSLRLNVDFTVNQIVTGYTLEALNVLNKLYAGIEYHPIKKIGLIAGVTLNAYYTDTTYSQYPEFFNTYKPEILYETTYTNDINVKVWLGGKVGLRFL